MSSVYTFSAEMTCVSCSNCITKALEKRKAQGAAISSFSVNLEQKLVTVEGTIELKEISDILSRTGITTKLVSNVLKN